MLWTRISPRGTAAARVFRFSAATLLSVAIPLRATRAQCADGTNGSCSGRPSARPSIDSNRIAFLPARTSGADPALAHLREGFVDLIAPYFNGELGSQAVEPGEALQTWTRAGAGPAPATQEEAIRVARQMGAGQVAYSSVTGTARRFTVATSILRVPSGAVIVPQVRVDGSPESLAVFARAMSTRLLAQREGAVQLHANDPGTSDNEAALAYINGVAAYRAQRLTDALQYLHRALQRDTNFVLAAYRLAICFEYFGPSAAGGDTAIWRRLWKQRERLSAGQRQLIDALVDAHGLLFRMANLSRLERAISLLPNSVEAWDLLGEATFHVGPLLGYKDWVPRAKAAYLHAAALSPALAVNAQQGLMDIAFMEGDRVAHARYARAYPSPLARYQAAILRGDPQAIHVARIEYAREEFPHKRYAQPLDGTVGGWPPRELDSLVAELAAAATTDEMRGKVAWTAAHAATNLGRPAQAADALWRRHGTDSAAVYFLTLMFAQDDSAAAERTFEMLDRGASLRVLSRTNGEWACNAALSRLRRGDTTGSTAIVAVLRPVGAPSLGEIYAAPHAQVNAYPRPPGAPATPGEKGRAREPMCGEVLRGALASVTGGDTTALHSADSLMRAMPMNCCDYWNYDVGLAYARRGQYRAAVAAVRRHWVQQSEPAPRLTIALLQEGRWSAKAGDTTAAIKAYQQYLRWRENPEPALVPQRDSARAELTALEKAVKNRKRVSPRPEARASLGLQQRR